MRRHVWIGQKTRGWKMCPGGCPIRPLAEPAGRGRALRQPGQPGAERAHQPAPGVRQLAAELGNERPHLAREPLTAPTGRVLARGTGGSAKRLLPALRQSDRQGLPTTPTAKPARQTSRMVIARGERWA